MKGFGIEIKNDLLEAKHIEAMDISVWLYLWLIDKITSVDEKGIGTVLGGKPIKFEEVRAELGISKNTYTNWITRLAQYPYITTKRTPYGLIFQVLKAHKRFTKKYVRTEAKEIPKKQGIPKISDSQKSKRDSQKTRTEIPKKLVGDSQKTRNVIKTIQDNTSDNTIDIAKDAASGKEINDLIDLFKDVNPSVNQLFKNTSQRAAIDRLLKKHGHQQLEWVIKSLKVSNKHQYAPTITKPSELEYKIGALIAFWQKEKAKQQKNKIIVIQNKKP